MAKGKNFFKSSKPKDPKGVHTIKSAKKEKVKKIKKIEQERTKKDNQKQQFPRISRFIPENTWKFWLKLGIVICLSVVAVWGNYLILQSLYSAGKGFIKVVYAREKLNNEMKLWQNITKEYPNYRDAYMASAVLAYRLGDRGKEQVFLRGLKLLDPNFPFIKTLEQLTNLQNLSQ